MTFVQDSCNLQKKANRESYSLSSGTIPSDLEWPWRSLHPREAFINASENVAVFAKMYLQPYRQTGNRTWKPGINFNCRKVKNCSMSQAVTHGDISETVQDVRG